jgi:hypothetical protein
MSATLLPFLDPWTSASMRTHSIRHSSPGRLSLPQSAIGLSVSDCNNSGSVSRSREYQLHVVALRITNSSRRPTAVVNALSLSVATSARGLRPRSAHRDHYLLPIRHDAQSSGPCSVARFTHPPHRLSCPLCDVDHRNRAHPRSANVIQGSSLGWNKLMRVSAAVPPTAAVLRPSGASEGLIPTILAKS